MDLSIPVDTVDVSCPFECPLSRTCSTAYMETEDTPKAPLCL